MHSMNRTSPRHCANGAHISSHIPAVPQQEVYTQASYTIPASCAWFLTPQAFAHAVWGIWNAQPLLLDLCYLKPCQ